MNRTRLAVLLFFLAVLTIIVPKLIEPRDPLRSALAQSFRVHSDMLFINMPPATGRYPGAVFVQADRLLPIEFVNPSDERLRRGPPVSVSVTMNTRALSEGTLGLGYFKQLIDSGMTKVMSVTVTDVVLIEMRAGDIKSILMSSDDAQKAAMRNSTVFVISKAYEGHMRVTLKTTSETQAETIVRELASAMPRAKVDFQIGLTNRISVTFSTPTVVAYELMKADYLSNSLSIEPSDVVFTPVKEAAVPPVLMTSPYDYSGPLDWGLLTLSSGVYPSNPIWDQTWNAWSAKTVQRELDYFAPHFRYAVHATPVQPLTRDAALSAARKSAQRAIVEGIDLIVAYYIGHSVVRRDGEIVLLTGDSSIDTIHTVDEATLSLCTLYDALDASDLPFVLLVDGCLESDAIDNYRESLGFVLPQRFGAMDYHGSEEYITDELSRYVHSLNNFATKHRFLHTSNPVIFAAKPGTVAPGVLDPLHDWGPLHGPLAKRIAWMVNRVRFTRPSRPLQEAIRGTVDFNITGELTSEGTISWSDFSKFRGIGRESANRSAATALNAEAFNGIAELAPFVDGTGFWVHDFSGNIWRWSTADDRRELVFKEQRLLSIVSNPRTSGRVVLDRWENSVSLEHADRVSPTTTIQYPGIDFIRGFPNPTLLVVEDNGDASRPDHVYRIVCGRPRPVHKLETSYVFDIVDGDDGAVFASMPYKGAIILLRDQTETVYVAGLTEPTQLANTTDHLYAISGDGVIVYRIGRGGPIDQMFVSDYINTSEIPVHPRRAFTVLNGNNMIIGTDGFIYRLRTSDVDWTPAAGTFMQSSF